MRSKKRCQQYHAKRRFSERLGVRFSQYLSDMLLHKIHSGQMKLLERQSNRVAIYEMSFTPRQQDMLVGDAKEMTVHVVYDRFRKNIVTVAEPGTPFDHMKEQPEDEPVSSR